MKFLRYTATFFIIFVVFFSFINPPSSYAAVSTPGGNNSNASQNSVSVPGGNDATTGTGLINPLKGGDLMSFLRGIIDLVIKIGTVVVILMLVYIGYLFATTSINPENKKDARTYLLWTLVGALILLGSQAIATGIEETVKALNVGP